MDFEHYQVSKKLTFSSTGKYLVELARDFPLRMNYYDFAHPHAAIPNYHDHLEIGYILKGSGHFAIGGKSYPVSQGDVFIVASGVFHLLEADPPGSLKVVNLYFLPELVYRPGSSETDLEYLLLFLNYQKALDPRIPLDPAASAPGAAAPGADRRGTEVP